MAAKPLLSVGTMVTVALGSKYYKDPITSVAKGVTKKRDYKVQILEVQGSSKGAAPHPYKVQIGDLNQIVWVDIKSVTKVQTESVNSPTVEVEQRESVPSEDKFKGMVQANGYNNLVNDPIPDNPGMSASAFTLSDKGREMFNDDEQIKRVIQNMGIVNRESVDDNTSLLYTKFDRNGCVDPYNGFNGARSYTFLTRFAHIQGSIF